MRIADKMQFDQVKGNIAKNRTQMSELQNQAATQKRVTKPSDDPLAASRVLSNRIDLQGNNQFGKSMTYARSFLEFTDQSLGELGDILMRAKELAVGQANDGTGNEHSRRVVATEMEQLYNQIVAIGNRKIGDRFIFGGFSTQASPFDQKGNYKGDAGEMMVHIDKDSFLPMNVPGGRVFLGKGVSTTGMVKTGPPQAKTIEEFQQQQLRLQPQPQQGPPPPEQAVAVRGPASLMSPTALTNSVEPNPEEDNGVNLFHVVRDFMISLNTNDKEGIQNVLEPLDDALNQVVLTRSQVGSRSSALDSYLASVERQKVDNKVAISQLEDADIFSTVSDINKAESTLQATLETSGKMIQPSLLQFLR